jgi:hypothetical protein
MSFFSRRRRTLLAMAAAPASDKQRCVIQLSFLPDFFFRHFFACGQVKWWLVIFPCLLSMPRFSGIRFSF